ncbi:MAG: transposase [Phycisphaerae bacterium]
MSEPLAYLITWTCYGTWLHGDRRGSVDDEHNVPDTPFLSPDSSRAASETMRLRNPPVELDARCRQIVEHTIEAHCRRRGWDILALNVRTNHVHVVVRTADVTPDRMMGQLKAWTTRRLREAGCVSANGRVWTHHGSTRYLWNEQGVDTAIDYVTYH